jgi:hypothetical protein
VAAFALVDVIVVIVVVGVVLGGVADVDFRLHRVVDLQSL